MKNLNISPQEAQQELAKRELARRKLNWFVKYHFEEYRENWHHRLIFEKLEAVERGEIRKLMIFVPPRHGKALEVDTPIPTPNGWKRIGDLVAGDCVFDEKGKQTKVIAVSEIWENRELFEVSSDDGFSVLADAEHEWVLRLDRGYNILKTYTTKYLAGRKSPRAPLLPKHGVIKTTKNKLLVDPYVLGLWLGDGTSLNGGFTSCFEDAQFFNLEIQKAGFQVKKRSDKYGYGIQNLLVSLRKIKVLGNKHIPFEYLWASEKDRLSLLQGLIDTDGHVSPSGQVEFCSMNKALAEGVRHLVVSLGYKASLIFGRASVNGKDCGEKYRVLFYMPNAARLPRKSERCLKIVKRKDRYLRFSSAGFGNTVCIQVDSPSHQFLCGYGMMPTHNSEIASINFPAWFFGRNPKKSIIAASYNSDLAISFGRKARNIVASSEYKNLFPNVFLAEDSKAAGQWNTNQGGEYTAVGIGGGTTGRGADVFLIDDPVKDKQEAESPVIQERNIGWYRAVARTRLTPNGARVLIQTRWHDLDLAGQILASEDDWDILDLSAIAETDEQYRKAGEALWPGQYSLEELLAIKKELGIELWSALYQQSPISKESQFFLKENFRYRTLEEVMRLNTRGFVTIDPAPGKNEKSDFIGVCINFVDSENFWNLIAYRIKFDAAQLIKLIFKIDTDYKIEAFGIEKGMYKDVLKPFLDKEMLERNRFLTIKELDHEQKNKHLRIKGLQPRYEAKSIFHIEGMCGDLEEELLRFPKAIHDDVSDAVAYQNKIAEKLEGNLNEKVVQPRHEAATEFEGDAALESERIVDLAEIAKW